MFQDLDENPHQFLWKLESAYNRVYPNIDPDTCDMQIKVQFWDGLFLPLKKKIGFTGNVFGVYLERQGKTISYPPYYNVNAADYQKM